MMGDGKKVPVLNHLANNLTFLITIWKLSKWNLYFVTECRQMILCFGIFPLLYFSKIRPWRPGPPACYETLMPAQIKFIGHYRGHRRITQK